MYIVLDPRRPAPRLRLGRRQPTRLHPHPLRASTHLLCFASPRKHDKYVTQRIRFMEFLPFVTLCPPLCLISSQNVDETPSIRLPLPRTWSALDNLSPRLRPPPPHRTHPLANAEGEWSDYKHLLAERSDERFSPHVVRSTRQVTRKHLMG